MRPASWASRNEKLARLRAVITGESAVLAFDLAADKQACAKEYG